MNSSVISTFLALLLAAGNLVSAQNCGCAPNEFGFCGTDASHCGPGCQSGPCIAPSNNGVNVGDVVTDAFFNGIANQGNPSDCPKKREIAAYYATGRKEAQRKPRSGYQHRRRSGRKKLKKIQKEKVGSTSKPTSKTHVVYQFLPIIKEVYANLNHFVNKPKTKKYGRIIWRIGLTLSPLIIDGTPEVDTHPDAALNEVVAFITGGIVKKWGGSIPATKLTSLFVVAQLLYELGNDLPINWGDFIPKKIAFHAEKTNKGILHFPATIWKVMLQQGFGTNVAPTSSAQIRVPNQSFLQDHLAFLNDAISSLIAQRDQLEAFLSFQKGGA